MAQVLATLENSKKAAPKVKIFDKSYEIDISNPTLLFELQGLADKISDFSEHAKTQTQSQMMKDFRAICTEAIATISSAIGERACNSIFGRAHAYDIVLIIRVVRFLVEVYTEHMDKAVQEAISGLPQVID